MHNLKYVIAAIVSVMMPLVGCDSQFDSSDRQESNRGSETGASDVNDLKDGKMKIATFGGGCFWCVEAVFLELEGVEAVESGYMGGEVAIKGDGGKTYSLADVPAAGYMPLTAFLNGSQLDEGRDYKISRSEIVLANPVSDKDNLYVVVDNPTYAQVCTKLSGHAEVIRIKYDPAKVSFETLIQVFWKTHDPTTLNRQGNDRGPQYRSAVFYHSDEQREKAESYKKKLNEVEAYPNPVVTEVTKASKYYPAEKYHQNYFNNNPNDGYCRALIPAKLEKLREVFGDKLKK
ncbi:MAG: peptide-methionine (S)-S-oxide reductase [Mariniblastus sp.]|jgi:peptide-methionine (S)-S-oxide reductase